MSVKNAEINQVILRILREHGNEASSHKLWNALAHRNIDISIGRLYALLDALNKDGFVTFSEAAGGPERGGRAKRIVRLTGHGLADVTRRQVAAAIERRLSRKEALILQILCANPDKEMLGLEIIVQSNNVLKRGTVYVYLHQLTEKGLAESREEENRATDISIPRRLYRATEDGQRRLSAHRAEAAKPRESFLAKWERVIKSIGRK